jgi:hypothetical protein
LSFSIYSTLCNANRCGPSLRPTSHRTLDTMSC